jgi:hypothetical protein
MPILWAGKRLAENEELRLRRVVALLRRIEDNGCTVQERESAAADRLNLERFLPENEHKWTPDELEFGAHHGPSFGIGESTVDQP